MNGWRVARRLESRRVRLQGAGIVCKASGDRRRFSEREAIFV